MVRTRRTFESSGVNFQILCKQVCIETLLAAIWSGARLFRAWTFPASRTSAGTASTTFATTPWEVFCKGRIADQLAPCWKGDRVRPAEIQEQELNNRRIARRVHSINRIGSSKFVSPLALVSERIYTHESSCRWIVIAIAQVIEAEV
jgi:hypothetical protein